jgi:hypothetical protein
MGLPVVLRPETEIDLSQARDWYKPDGPELAAGAGTQPNLYED